MFGTGVAGLLLPWLLAPIIGDERYHYVAAPTRMDGSLLNVFMWTINDIGPRMAHGRIAPVGVFAQQVGYLLGMQLAFATGIPLVVAHGIIKAVLLLSIVASFALLLRAVRRRDGERLDRGLRGRALLVFTALLLLGVTATSPVRNGWTAYIVLCIGGVALLLVAGAVSAWALRLSTRTGAPGRLGAAAVLFVLGAAIMLSYEMHWAAVPFAIVVLGFTDTSAWRHRIILIVSITAGWLAAFVWTRLLLANASGVNYSGTRLDLGGPVLRTATLQVLNAIPGSGVRNAIRTVGEGLPVPGPFQGAGWLWGLLTALGFALLLARPRARTTEPTAADRVTLMVLGAGLIASAGAVALVTSVSAQSHDIVNSFGDTYRGTAWIWACLAGAGATALVSISGGRRTTGLVVVAPVALAAIVVGVLVWPTTVSAIQTIRAVDQYALWETAQAQLVSGASEPMAQARRCELAEQARTWAKGDYFGKFLPFHEEAFARQWQRPWCPSDVAGAG